LMGWLMAPSLTQVDLGIELYKWFIYRSLCGSKTSSVVHRFLILANYLNSAVCRMNG
jgi:hypothetical protein